MMMTKMAGVNKFNKSNSVKSPSVIIVETGVFRAELMTMRHVNKYNKRVIGHLIQHFQRN